MSSAVVALAHDVTVDGLLGLHRVQSAAGDHHGLGVPVDLHGGLLPEVLDDDLGLLVHLVGVQGRVSSQRGLSPPGLQVGVHRALGVREPVVYRVGRVVAQHVQDEALGDGLAHRVDVEGVHQFVLAQLPEQVESLGLRSRGEGKEGQVLLLATVCCRFDDDISRIGGLLGGVLGLFSGREEGFGAAEHPFEVLHGFPGGGGVSLVDDHREVSARHLLGLAVLGVLSGGLHHNGELLQCCDDDAGCVALQRLLELRRVLVDPHDRAQGVVEPGDGGLKLLIEHLAVGDDDDLVEDRLVVVVVEPGELMGRPCDGVALTRPGRVLDEPIDPSAVTLRRVKDRADGVPLVEARKQDRAVAVVDEVAQDVEPRVGLPHLLPQV